MFNFFRGEKPKPKPQPEPKEPEPREKKPANQPPPMRGGPISKPVQPPQTPPQTQGPRGPKPPLKTATSDCSEPKVNTNDALVLDFATTRPKSDQLLFCDDIWWHIGMQTDPFGLLAILRSCKLLYYIFQDENLWIGWLKTIRPEGWEDPLRAAYDLGGKSWRLCPLGKCKARYIAHMKDLYSASRRRPRCHFCHRDSTFPKTEESAALRLVLSENRFFTVHGTPYYLCSDCYLTLFKCLSCKEEFIMDSNQFKKMALSMADFGRGSYSQVRCELPKSGKYPEIEDVCHFAEYISVVQYEKNRKAEAGNINNNNNNNPVPVINHNNVFRD